MITLEKHKQAVKLVNNFIHLVKFGTGAIRIETKTGMQFKNLFKSQAKDFWKLEGRNDWLNKCYLKAQADLSKLQKMGMSNNPDERISFIANLTKEWNDGNISDKTMNDILLATYESGYNFAGQEVLNEFKVGVNFKLRDLDVMQALENRANLTSPQINDTSWELVQNTIADGFWKEGKNTDKVARDIRDLFDETYAGRAENIARTETGNIISEAQLESYKRMEVEKKGWIAEPTACELCAPLNGQKINIDEDFDNGLGWKGQSPLVHPSCKCDIYAVTPDEFTPSNYWTGN